MKYVAAIFDPRPINLNLLTKTASVLSMAAGRAHLLILTNQGLFTLGNNAYGQCGRPIIEDEDYHKSRVVFRIPDIEGNKIAAVTAGQDHRYMEYLSLDFFFIFTYWNLIWAIINVQ